MYDKAIADFGEAIRLDPRDYKVWFGRGDAWKSKREFAKAVADYTEAILIQPEFAPIYRDRATAGTN